MRTVIRGGTVVTPGATVNADLVIEYERIAGIVNPGVPAGADEVLDATGLVILPGAIDAHTHFLQDDPDFGPPLEDEFEGFTNGGRGALAGGVTTVVEMPQATQPTIDGRSFQRKRELAEKDAVTDFALWGGACSGQAESAIRDQIASGAVGIKAFMCESDPSFPGINDAELLATLRILKDTPLMLGLHAESDALLQAGLAQMHEENRTDPLAHSDSRPPIVEVEAVHRAIFFAEQTGGWAHIVHLSTPQAAELIKQAKARGVNVTAETCPQYLALDLDDLTRLRGFAKCAPAIRSAEEVEALWSYVTDGTIDCITSDHCSFTAASKAAGQDDIWQAPNGLTGIQTLLPVMISEGRRRGLSWSTIAELTSTAPARLWHLAPRKGSIQIDADADLVFVDPEAEWLVQNADLLHTQKWSPFEGSRLSGRIVRTMVRGTTAYALEGGVQVKPGFGQFLPATS